jgi:signal transduction histidine kinase
MELRFDLHGRCAVRVSGGPVAPRHAEAVPPPAAWRAEARCGAAVGWLLGDAPPADEAGARAELEREVARRTALALQRRAAAWRALGADLLERLTHRLRTDVMTLQAAAEAAALLEDADRAELARAGREAQRRLTAARLVMRTLDPGAPVVAEPVIDVLRGELEAVGREDVPIAVPDERALALVPGAGWAAVARLLAADPRLEAFAVEPDAAGWRIACGAPGAPVAWSDGELGALADAGRIVVAAGGEAAAERGPGGLRVTLAVPAAPSTG